MYAYTYLEDLGKRIFSGYNSIWGDSGVFERLPQLKTRRFSYSSAITKSSEDWDFIRYYIDLDIYTILSIDS